MLLTDKTTLQSIKNVLIACNKQDYTLRAKSSKAIQQMLEKEMFVHKFTLLAIRSIILHKYRLNIFPMLRILWQDSTTRNHCIVSVVKLIVELTFVHFSSLLRVTQSASLESTTGASTNSIFIGKKGKDFEFKDMKVKVEFCECSAKQEKSGDGADILAIENWLTKIA